MLAVLRTAAIDNFLPIAVLNLARTVLVMARRDRRLVR